VPKAAVPAASATVPDGKAIPLSKKVTVPVAPVVTVAVNVTKVPGVTGCPPVDDVRMVVVVARFTVCERADDVEVLKEASPP
jgi:hypothetical protein